MNVCSDAPTSVSGSGDWKTYRKQNPACMVKHLQANPSVWSVTESSMSSPFDDTVRWLKNVTHLLFHLPFFILISWTEYFVCCAFILLNLFWQLFIPCLITESLPTCSTHHGLIPQAIIVIAVAKATQFYEDVGVGVFHLNRPPKLAD